MKLEIIVVCEIDQTKKYKYHKTRKWKGAWDREGTQTIAGSLSRVT